MRVMYCLYTRILLCLYTRHIIEFQYCRFSKKNARYKDLDVWKWQKIDSFGPELGRHGSPRAHTEGQRSHGLQEGFWMPPGPLGHHIISKNVV